jgi:ABC-type nickel/cobalt efflux system permease component RcnA
MRRSSLRVLLFLFSLCSLCLWGEYLFAHPVPKDNHDRIIEVMLTPDAVVVQYHLEIDEYRAVRDLPREDFAGIGSPKEIADVFIRHVAPLLHENLFARLDGQELTFTGQGRRDETVKDHLRCDFTFQGAWKPAPGPPHTFTFREGNYDQEDFNRIQLTLTAGPGVMLQSTTAPDKALLKRPPLEYKPGDAERLRKVSATFLVTSDAKLLGARSVSEGDATLADAAGSEASGEGQSEHPRNLWHILLDTRRGLAVLLLLAAGFGAVHALTPGHGKTLVAAYLVGERGTVWHALLLGLATTVTHTGAVFLLAVVFLISPPAASLIYYVQGLVGGLFIAGLGLWLLLRRLSGRADHFHLGGHSHHHHHHHHDHDHDHDHTHIDHSHGPIAAGGSSVRWWHLLLLGMRGGLVPCWDAIILLCLAISAQRLWLGVPLLLAFSAGLAGVLVALGVGVVWARDWAVARWGGGPRMRKLVGVLPLVSAAVITALGLWLCYDSLHPETPPPVHVARP